MALEAEALDGPWVETASSIRSFLTCQTLYWFRYAKLRRPLGTPRPLLIGSAFHGVVEAYWRAVQGGGPTSVVLAATAVEARAVLAGGDAHGPNAAEGLDPFDRQLAARLGLEYAASWQAAPEGRPVAVERAFEVPARAVAPLAPPAVRLAGKIDLLLVDGSDYLTVVEHKTAGAEKPGYFERLRLDTQLSVYDVVARTLVPTLGARGYAGMLYDVAAKPAIKPLKRTEEIKLRNDGEPRAGQRLEDETPQAYGQRVTAALRAKPAESFKRYRLARPQTATDEGRRHLAQALRGIGHARLYGPTRNPGACFDHGTPCAYFDVCTGVVSLDDATRFRSAPLHEELPGAASAEKEP